MAVAAVLSSMTMAGSSFKVKHTGTFGTLKKKHTTHGITIFLLSPFGNESSSSSSPVELGTSGWSRDTSPPPPNFLSSSCLSYDCWKHQVRPQEEGRVTRQVQRMVGRGPQSAGPRGWSSPPRSPPGLTGLAAPARGRHCFGRLTSPVSERSCPQI